MKALTNAPLIMLVDDNDIDLFLNKKFLSVGGITDKTVACLSAKEAMNYLKANISNRDKLPSVILLDIQMPDVNGFEFLEQYGELPEKVINSIEIIMLSSSIDPVDLNRARDNEHVIDIIKKPLNSNELKDILKKRDIIKAA